MRVQIVYVAAAGIEMVIVSVPYVVAGGVQESAAASAVWLGAAMSCISRLATRKININATLKIECLCIVMLAYLSL